MSLRVIALIGVLAALTPAIWAQDYDLTLHHTEINDLPAPSRSAYEAAVSSLNHADIIGAVNSMAEAARLAPDAPEIQIHFVTLARRNLRADNFGVERAVALGNEMITAYERILSNERLPPWIHQIAMDEMNQVDQVLMNLDSILHERYEAGNAFIAQHSATLERAAQARERMERRLAAQRAAREATAQGDVYSNPLLPENIEGSGRQPRINRDVDANPLLPSVNNQSDQVNRRD
jgi:hypothetical protein